MKQRIKLVIAGRPYTFTVDESREEIMRQAVKEVNLAIDRYKSRMANIDDIDALSMIILQYAVHLIEIQQKDEVGELVEELKLLDKRLEDYIQTSNR